MSALYVVEDRGHETPCWVWRGRMHALGYGVIAGTKSTLAHRAIYEQSRRPLARSEVLHHRCEVPACVNPDHVEPMTQSAHMQIHNPRSVITHCRHGHPYDDENTYRQPDGKRRCRTCHRNESARRRDEQRAKAVA